MTGPNEGWGAAVALVIPAYNEGRSIGPVLARCVAIGLPIIVVDDGSTDDTAAIARTYPVVLLRHAANRGKGAALLTGIGRALADGATDVVTLDADGQHRPEDVTRLIAAARRSPGAIVVGSRRADGSSAPRARYRANRVADFWISWAAGQPIEDTQSGFRLYPADMLRRLPAGCAGSCGFAFESKLLIDAARDGVAIVPIAIPALYGDVTLRASHFRPVRDIAHITVMVAAKLLGSFLYPVGLWRVLIGRSPAGRPARDLGRLAEQEQSER